MKNIFLNLKRFDIPTSIGGVNNVGYREDYGKTITSFIDNLDGFNFVIFFQEFYYLVCQNLLLYRIYSLTL